MNKRKKLEYLLKKTYFLFNNCSVFVRINNSNILSNISIRILNIRIITFDIIFVRIFSKNAQD